MKFDIDARAGGAVTVPRAQPRSLPKNPERLAWLVIWGAFSVCLFLSITLPLAARHFVLFATELRTSTLQSLTLTADSCGTVQLTPPNAAQPSAVTCDPMSFAEGSSIATDNTSRALITLFDDSTAQVLPSSRLTVLEMRQPRFQWSELPNSVEIRQERGLALYAAAPAVRKPSNPDGRPIHLVVHTPDFDVTLNEGSYSIEVTDAGTQVVVTRGGPAVVQSARDGHQVNVAQGQRVQVARGQQLAEPIAAAQNLIGNGDFSGDLKAWSPLPGQSGEAPAVKGVVEVVSVDNRRALHISRSGSGNSSANTGVHQQLSRDISYFRSVVFSADVRLHRQTLSGGGYLSSEYPLLIRLRYRDVNGNEFDFVRGFYYQNEDENPTKNGEKIPPDQWVPIRIGNLLQGGADPRPFYLIYIEIYASGWDYDSYISDTRLTVE